MSPSDSKRRHDPKPDRDEHAFDVEGLLEDASETTPAVSAPEEEDGPRDVEEEASEESAVRFDQLGLCDALLDALDAAGYKTPTPIQAQAIPHLLEERDLLGVAQTGTGKTAAFALPILDLLDEARRRPISRKPRALVLTPTRELASQIQESFERYGQSLRLRSAVVFGGVGKSPQIQALRRGVDILVATPGRLLDLMSERFVELSQVEYFVLDEADRMLDMGFLRDVQRIVDRLPEDRQSLLFSATMPDDIVQLANKMLIDPLRIEVTPPSTTVERIQQDVFFVAKADKRALLREILRDEDIKRALVFARTKHGADRLSKQLVRAGIGAAALHGNKTQGARERALQGFRSGRVRVLVATDIAARGLDVPGVTHVINFDLPNLPESYVHRIGRTARAGRDGRAISFCDESEQEYLDTIERAIRMKLDVASGRPWPRQPRSARGKGKGRPQGRGRQGGQARQSAGQRRAAAQKARGQQRRRGGSAQGASPAGPRSRNRRRRR